MKRFDTAINVQDACNPSGVAHAFINACNEFRDSPEFTGTDSIKRDPALRLIAHKLADLMGMSDVCSADYNRCYTDCLAKVLEPAYPTE